MNMKPDVFAFDDYKKLLQNHVKSEEVKRGYLRELAEAAGCQRSYLSSVLHSKNHLTPDQACAIARFWALSSSEADYFLALVDYARAGTQALRARLKEKLQTLKIEQQDLSTRLERRAVESHENDEGIYYSSWIYSAIHILTSIPEFQSLGAIAKKLSLPKEFVRSRMEILKKMKLVEEFQGDCWRHSSISRHISRASPLVILHHNNWRQQALLKAQSEPDSGVHFTTVTAMSESAYSQILALMLKHIDRCNEISEPSSSERIVCFTLDFFPV